MEIGKKVKKVPSHAIAENGHRTAESREGTVRWVHPQGRFYVVEFVFGGGRFHESFYPDLAPNVGALRGAQ